MKYLSIENAKTVKGESSGYLTGILYLAPANEAKNFNVPNACPYASAGCKAACLFTAGRGAFSNVREARIRKSIELMAGKTWNESPDPARIDDIKKDIKALIRKAGRLGLKTAVRLNGTSDYPVHQWGIMEAFPDVTFYDYTKDSFKYALYLKKQLPNNYFLTYSKSESERSGHMIPGILKRGGQVAIVFDKVPATYNGQPVIQGDDNDLIFLRGPGILGLKAKGRARRDTSGFVVITSKGVN